AGGVLSGAGVSGLYFDPILAGVGPHVLNYTVTDANGCVGTVTKTVQVIALPKPEILNTDLTFCENEQPVLVEVSPDGGILSGAGVSGLYFDPILAGVGSHVLTYTVTDANGCVGTVTKAVPVIALPNPEILNTDLTFCENEQPILIEVSPAGGVLSGVGINGLYFEPEKAGAGNHTLTYTISNQNNCIEISQKQVVIFERVFIDLGPDRKININDTLKLTPYTNGSTILWNNGSTGDQQNIVAKNLGIGIFNIWAIATNNENCFAKDSMLLTIDFSDIIDARNQFPKAYIFPNPIKNGFYLMLEENEIIEYISLYGINGRLYLNGKPSSFPYFDTSGLSSGTYVLKLKTNRQNVVFQLVKF
ncbi:MAG: T9SS type A sorting domain-containing protein, partial [Prolixibacteraceae bacterium]